MNVAGTAAAPAYSLTGGATGLYQPSIAGANTFGITVGGVAHTLFTRNVSTGAQFLYPNTDNNVTLGGPANRWAAVDSVLLQGANGSASAPTHTFNNDLTSGMYLASVGNLGIAAGGTTVATASSSGLVALPPTQLRLVSGTLGAGEVTIFAGGSGQTLTLPSSTANTGTTNKIVNNSGNTVTIAAGSSTTLDFFGTEGSFLLGAGTSIEVMLVTSASATPTLQWYTVDYTGFGVQVAYNQVTSNFTNQPASTSSWYAANTTSGSVPTITLPNDNRIYKVEMIGNYWIGATSNEYGMSIGTSASTLIAASINASVNTIATTVVPIVAPQVTGTGQTISIYTKSFAGTGSSYLITCGASATAPFSLAAYRVA
jgi:hypothetical protein